MIVTDAPRTACAVCGGPLPPSRPSRPRTICSSAACKDEWRHRAARQPWASSSGDRLPTGPLVAVITRQANLSRGSADALTGISDDHLAALLDRVGVSERMFFAWRRGEKPDATSDRIDAFLVALDALWFDVYNEQTVRRPAIVVRSYRMRQRRVYRMRELIESHAVGDLGPDVAELERIRQVFEGTSEVAA